LQNKIGTGVSLSKETIKRIDKERGDVSRSQYITRLLEQAYKGGKQKSNVERQRDPGHQPSNHLTDSTTASIGKQTIR
jgi:hypothetical protein